mmetsp:Transcript_133113/g.344498  ORF Transcript_133113/g.344498 Transcript_133113/m.344498 type:complete len:317 (-) Transcript_133113:1756-2706(-)
MCCLRVRDDCERGVCYSEPHRVLPPDGVHGGGAHSEAGVGAQLHSAHVPLRPEPALCNQVRHGQPGGGGLRSPRPAVLRGVPRVHQRARLHYAVRRRDHMLHGLPGLGHHVESRMVQLRRHRAARAECALHVRHVPRGLHGRRRVVRRVVVRHGGFLDRHHLAYGHEVARRHPHVRRVLAGLLFHVFPQPRRHDALQPRHNEHLARRSGGRALGWHRHRLRTLSGPSLPLALGDDSVRAGPGAGVGCRGRMVRGELVEAYDQELHWQGAVRHSGQALGGVLGQQAQARCSRRLFGGELLVGVLRPRPHCPHPGTPD